VSRRDDLIEHIRASYGLIHEFEQQIMLSDNPKEKARDRRAIEEQRDLAQAWLEELLRLGGALPADIAEIATSAARGAPDAAPPPPAGGGTHYEFHIEHAQGLAIGDGARVETAALAAPGAGGNDVYARYTAGLERLLQELGRAHPRYQEALAMEQRLGENVSGARLYGDNETRRSERAEIVARLNHLAMETIGKSFNALLE
jgi:hypothetical protein